MEYNPTDPFVLYQKGEVLLSLGQRDKGCDCLLKSKQFGNNVIDDVIEKENVNNHLKLKIKSRFNFFETAFL